MAIGSNPSNWDTDGDGIGDGDEIGADSSLPKDTDGDGWPDVVESALADADRDCVPDQFDFRNHDPNPPPDLVTKVNCTRKGVCGAAFALVGSRCEDGVASCDYSLVPGYQANESRCDGLDNDCDGLSDEGFTLEGIPVGMPCAGGGECGLGVVECTEDGGGTRCSTEPGGSRDASKPEVCNGLDDDCDGVVDNGLTLDGRALGEPCNAKGTCGPGVVECAPDGRVVCSSGPGGSEDRSVTEACNGLDDDCDGQTDEDAPVEGNPLDYCKPVGICATFLDKVRLVCRDGKPACDFSTVPGYSGKTEALCDGRDDDCDGFVDEDFSYTDPFGASFAVGQPCGTGVCAGGGVICSPDRSSAVCSSLGRAGTEVCNDADDDCDGLVDEGWPKVFDGSPTLLDVGMPPPRARAALAACPSTDSLYLYGGVGRLGENKEVTMALADFWRYDLREHRFSPIPGPTPGGRFGSALLCDAVGGRLFLVAGLLDESSSPGLWSFSLDFHEWKPIPVKIPVRGSVGAALDPDARTLLVVRMDEPESVVVDLETSSAFPIPVSLPRRWDPAFAHARGVLFISGGRDEQGVVRGDLFRVEMDGTFSFLGSGFPMRARHALAALDDGSLFMVGGEGPDGAMSPEAFRMDPDTGSVQPVAVFSLVPPLVDAALVSLGDALYLHSGLTSDGRGFRKVMRYDGKSGQWTSDLPEGMPGPRAGGVIALLRSRARAFFLGGYAVDVAATYPVSDVWSLSLLDGRFQRLQTSGTAANLIRGAATVDEGKGVVYLFGGLDRPPGPEAVETATFLRLDSRELVVEAVPGGSGPSPRAAHTLVAAGASGILLLYGGTAGGEVLGDVWAWTEEASWFPLDAIPHPRRGHAAFWDPVTQRMIVVAGIPGGNIAAFDPLNRTWTALLEHPDLQDAGGAAFFDPDSRSVLFVSSSGSRVLRVVLPLDGEPTGYVSSLSVVSLEALTAFDPFRRRALFFGGIEPGGRTLSAWWALNQTCPAGGP